MAVVTVSRLYGAGGMRVAQGIADALGLRLVDRELVEEAARRIGVDPELAEHLDERAPGLLEEVGLALGGMSPELGAARVDERALAGAVGRVIESLADRGGYVILGRGGQAILRDRAGARHVKLVADLDDRARRIAEWQDIGLDEARDRCRRVDADRAGYVRRHFDADIEDALLYDVILNTSRIGLEEATRVAVEAVR